MSQKSKFSKEEIIDACISIVREYGHENISARNVGSKLNSSSKVIFSVFKNMKELLSEVIKKSCIIFDEFATNEIKNNNYPPYKALGMAYILFAKQETNLFKLAYMRNRTNETISGNKPIHEIELIQKSLGLNEEDAFKFHLEMWVCVHGIATMIATNFLNWDIDKISEMLTDIFQGLKNRFKNENN